MADDGDPLDILLISRYPIMPASLINCRPVGILEMEDEAGKDSKIICVPSDKVCSYYSYVKNVNDIPETLKNEIKFFFEKYKELDSNKWTKVNGFKDINEAKKIILSSLSK